MKAIFAIIFSLLILSVNTSTTPELKSKGLDEFLECIQQNDQFVYDFQALLGLAIQKNWEGLKVAFLYLYPEMLEGIKACLQ